MTRFSTEQALGAKAVAHFEREHWDVYQEVEVFGGGPCADIVGLLGPLVMVCEVKRSLSLALLAQADHWRRYANLVYVAVPAGRRSPTSGFFYELCSERGIGVIRLGRDGWVGEDVAPVFRRRVDAESLRAVLCPEHKTHAQAGSANGGHFTPFRRTLRRLEDVVGASPGIPVRDAFASIDHHYGSPASARAQLARLIESGVIKTLRLEREGRALRIYPAEVRR